MKEKGRRKEGKAGKYQREWERRRREKKGTTGVDKGREERGGKKERKRR